MTTPSVSPPSPPSPPSAIVILGAGQAAASAAFALRTEGYRGALTLVGDEVHLPYERPQLSKEMLRAEPLALRSHRKEDAYRAADITLRLGARAVRVDAEASVVHLDDGTSLPYDRLLVATGVRPRILPAFAGDARVTALRTVEDAHRLRADLDAQHRFVIVGGGVIGLEVASAISARGGKPVVVESAPRLMMRSVDETIAAHLDRVHRERGVTFLYGKTVTGYAEDGTLTLSDGSTLPADRVVLGIGVEPNIDMLDGLGITDPTHGVRVDAFGRTTIPTIFATGDIAAQPHAEGHRRIETWANAQDHAGAVARNMLGHHESMLAAYAEPTWFWSDQGNLKLQVAGDGLAGEQVLRGDPAGSSFSSFRIGPGNVLLGCASINAPKDNAVARRWLVAGARVDPEALRRVDNDIRKIPVEQGDKP